MVNRNQLGGFFVFKYRIIRRFGAWIKKGEIQCDILFFRNSSPPHLKNFNEKKHIRKRNRPVPLSFSASCKQGFISFFSYPQVFSCPQAFFSDRIFRIPFFITSFRYWTCILNYQVTTPKNPNMQ